MAKMKIKVTPKYPILENVRDKGLLISGTPFNNLPFRNSDTSPYISTEEASKRGLAFMKIFVNSMINR